ncbi:GIY-YIG nuclease family protein [Microbacterium esteraromaticum]|uniref:GIY-YIG nuclease family protein n=1 Tax=Microbacterium esteraromaticum TaxID=57043 RepID=UPI001C94717E|nr:GIY-YIG nuclease family protein [Microbacterium esteraromaticum]MBY6061014.1 GIY-YIG nuclease family protein [Microbacterium esteraromaticum]
MALTLGPILADAGIDPAEAIAIRHAYVKEHEDGSRGIHADSTDAEILNYTRGFGANGSFPAAPPRYWVVFIKEGSNQARLWSVIENRGELENDSVLRTFDISATEHMAELRKRLVIGWRSPRTWWMRGTTAASYPVDTIADAEPIPFPGFDRLMLDYAQLQAVIREPRYASWRTALSSVTGVYLITDARDGRQYVGKADGAENILQRWSAYAANGHGGNVELRGMDPSTFRYSLLRVFDPSTPEAEINIAENHYKLALDSRFPHGLNRN